MKFAIVESPLQLLNAFEAASHLDKPIKYIIRLSGARVNDKQLMFLINFLKIENVLIIELNARNKTPLSIFKALLLKLYIMPYASQGVIVGNYESSFIRFLLGRNTHKLLLVDDGAKTLSQQNSFNNENHVDFFSAYDLVAYNGQSIYKNDYERLKSLLDSKQLTRSNDQVLFLGAKLSECGIIEEDLYIAYISTIINRYKEDGRCIIYIPHREESENKISKIKCLSNIRVMHVDYPVELLGIYENEIPSTVASFYSTALYTLNKIYGLQVDCFEFDYSLSPSNAAIKSVYDLYRTKFNIFKV